MTRRGFIGVGTAGAAALLLPVGAAGAHVKSSSSSVRDIAGHLAEICTPQLTAIRAHPWIRAAAHDRLKDPQIGSWATQDLLWFPQIAPAYTAGFAGAPPAALAAEAYLNGNDANETAYLTRTSKGFRNAPGADRLWPGFLGYGAWGGLIGERDAVRPAPHTRALTVVWGAEYAYHQAWGVVLAGRPAQPWAKFGAGNWGGKPFGGMVTNLSAGLNTANAAAPVPLAEIEEIARQVFLWEFRAWTDVWKCAGWTIGG